jgi:hypothetical protein
MVRTVDIIEKIRNCIEAQPHAAFNERIAISSFSPFICAYAQLILLFPCLYFRSVLSHEVITLRLLPETFRNFVIRY